MTREEVIALVRDARVWIGKGDNDRVAIGPVADGRALRDELLRLLEGELHQQGVYDAADALGMSVADCPALQAILKR